MLPRSWCITFAVLLAWSSFVVAQVNVNSQFINPHQYDNGTQLNLNIHSGSGFYFDNTLALNQDSGVSLFPPSDVPSTAYYQSSYWNGTATMLGEQHALRLEQVITRRFMVIISGIFYGFFCMRLLFKFH